MIVRPNAAERAPGANVVPAEVAGQHDHAIAALEHADVDRDRRHGAEECADVVGVAVKRGRDLGAVPANVVEEVADGPDEDPRIPQVPVAPHLLGARAVGLLDESRDAPNAVLELLAGLDVAEARIGARRDDADRDERVVLLGDLGARG